MSVELNAKIDLTKGTRKFVHFWEMGFGSERPFMVLREDNIVEHYRMGVEELGFKYVRAHGIFHDEMGIYNETYNHLGEKIKLYNWRAVDKVYDKLLEIGLKPFVELSFMPTLLASGNKRIFNWGGNVTLPKNFNDWAELVSKFVQHLIDRYGTDEIRQWYFEVWNEPNLTCFFDGTQEDYFKLYDFTAEAIKAVDPKLKVGGPSTAKGAWIDAFLHHCFEGKNYATGKVGAPVDFVSYHGYPTDVAFYTGAEAINFEEIDYWRELSRQNKEIVRAYEKRYGRKIEIHVTEWNSSANHRDIRHEDSNQAAFICKTIFDVEGNVDSFFYWTLSDIFEEQGWPESEFHGGFGLITVNGIKKPAYNAFKMLHMLGNEKLLVEIEEHPDNIGVVATKNDNAIQVLLWNYIPPISKMEDKGILYDMDKAKNYTIKLVISGIKNKITKIYKYTIDDNHSNTYNIWLNMGKPAQFTEKQLKSLKQNMNLELTYFNNEVKIENGILETKCILKPASVVLLIIE